MPDPRRCVYCPLGPCWALRWAAPWAARYMYYGSMAGTMGGGGRARQLSASGPRADRLAHQRPERPNDGLARLASRVDIYVFFLPRVCRRFLRAYNIDRFFLKHFARTPATEDSTQATSCHQVQQEMSHDGDYVHRDVLRLSARYLTQSKAHRQASVGCM
jgi:hypothetical protein